MAAEIINFDCLNIIPFDFRRRGILTHSAEAAYPDYIRYQGRLKYVIVGEVNLTTNIYSIGETTEEVDRFGFLPVYESLLEYVASKLPDQVDTLDSIYFTPTAVTLRLASSIRRANDFSRTLDRAGIDGRFNLRGRNSDLTRVPFNVIKDGFESDVINFVNLVDQFARQERPINDEIQNGPK